MTADRHLGFGMTSSDHPRFVFDGLNILLKLHVDGWLRLYFARYRDLYIRPVWLEIAYSRRFRDFLGIPQMNSDIVASRNPQNDCHSAKHVVWAINRENLSTSSTWIRVRE